MDKFRGPRFLDRKGNAISIEEAMELFEDINKRTVGLTEIGKHTVSTVHLVVGHCCPDSDCDSKDHPFCAFFETAVRYNTGGSDEYLSVLSRSKTLR